MTMPNINPWAGLALAAMLAGAAGTAVAQAAPAPPIRDTETVTPSPERAVPDAGEDDEGLEAREAIAPLTPSSRPSSTLNAQYAALQTAASAAPDAGVMQAAMNVTSAADPAPAPQPGNASVALAQRIVQSAQAFTGYMRRASAIRPDYADAAGVSRALQTAGTYQAAQLQEGAVAYVALAALQDARFVTAVQRLGAAAGADRVELAATLAADPRLVLRTPGADGAALRAGAALGNLGADLQKAGTAVKQSAYSIQHAAWSRTGAAEPQATLAALKVNSLAAEPLGDDAGGRLMTSLSSLRRTPAAGSGRLTPTIARGLTLAALAVLGQAGEEHADHVAALLTEGGSAQCLKMARLNLYQCLAVAGPEYEDVFCVGEHAMLETARCVADASGWMPATAPSTPAEPHAVSIMAPVALSQDPPPAPAVQAVTLPLQAVSLAGR